MTEIDKNGARQMAAARTALVLANGGTLSATAILGTSDTL